MSEVVIVVDAQNDFLREDGALPVPGAEALIAPMERWLAGLDSAQTSGILFTFDTHDPKLYPASAEAKLFPPHCLKGTTGWELAVKRTAIDPRIPQYCLEKGVFDMWAEDGLAVTPFAGLASEPPAGAPTAACSRDAFFDDLKAKGIDRLTVIGVAADYCVRWALDGLVRRGFCVTVLRDLTRGIEQQILSVVRTHFAGAPVSVTAADGDIAGPKRPADLVA